MVNNRVISNFSLFFFSVRLFQRTTIGLATPTMTGSFTVRCGGLEPGRTST